MTPLFVHVRVYRPTADGRMYHDASVDLSPADSSGGDFLPIPGIACDADLASLSLLDTLSVLTACLRLSLTPAVIPDETVRDYVYATAQLTAPHGSPANPGPYAISLASVAIGTQLDF